MTTPKQKKLHALLNERGLGDRDDGLAYISKALQREVTTTKELTKRDAMRVIDDLERPGEEPEPEFDGDDWSDVAQPGGQQ